MVKLLKNSKETEIGREREQDFRNQELSGACQASLVREATWVSILFMRPQFGCYVTDKQCKKKSNGTINILLLHEETLGKVIGKHPE